MALSNSERSVPNILTDLLTQFSTLFRKESQLARTEMSEKMGQVGAGVALLISGAVLMIPALVILLGAAVAGLERAGMDPPWVAAVIVGGIALAIGLVLLLIGANRLKARNLVPHKTLHQIQEDASVARRQANKDQARQNHDYKRAA